ncbi:hypothetical protein BDZ45DRAFT_787149 [Acephala macrosclerotiorum]|nr:hypothetical protein BDZ45DRAFT_787149 [Acephala macrosclerotiorum]
MAAVFGPKTERARLYSHPVTVPGAGQFNHEPIAGFVPFKSGRTPTYRDGNTSPPIANQDTWERYQESRFEGFTTPQLKLKECFAFEWRIGDNVTVFDTPSHDIFLRENWQCERPFHVAKWPLGNGCKGFWEVDNGNLAIREAMKPSLRIATLVLNNVSTWP